MKIAIIGGGIAGHMAAAHIGRYLPQANLYHIYDPAVPLIGVGEGTLPAFRNWLDQITGLTFTQLQKQCAITWKKGIRFEDWGNTNTQFNHFFGGDNIAYHISAEKLCPLLAHYIQAEQWNRHVLRLDSNGRNVTIHFREGQTANFDFVFDARGFPRVQTAEHLPLQAIPTNAALVKRGPVAPFQGATRAVARPHGWIFVIPLATDTAYGYIFNADLSEKDAIEADFETFLQQDAVSTNDQSRYLHFPNFRRREFFDGALFTIGNTASFLEPLEATAIGLILHQLQNATYWLRDELVGVSGEERWQPAVLQQFNDDIANAIDNITLFVGWHYACGSAYDTPFWQHARQNFLEQWTATKNSVENHPFEKMLKFGAAFPPEKLTLIPDPQTFMAEILPNKQSSNHIAGFDEFSFAQIGHGIGYFSPASNSTPFKNKRSPQTAEPRINSAKLQQARNLLEQQLLEGNDPLPALTEKLSPEYLDLLFYVEAGVSIKNGLDRPKSFSPANLLSLLQKAATSGYVPIASPVNLRQLLEQLASDLRQQGAWLADEPLWWEPLPEPSPEETLWNRFEAAQWLHLPDKTAIRNALGETAESRLWLSIPHLLNSACTRSIHSVLETAYQTGQLPMERGGIGDAHEGEHHHHDDRRTDYVRYITGLEAGLLQISPELAALAQYLLHYLGDYFKDASGRSMSVPQRAMLSRYPQGTAGFAPHMDNPGGEKDNGRVLTMVIYLNSPEQPCTGGEIALWKRNSRTTEPPIVVLPPHSGSAVLFDSRRVPHQVRPLGDGPARWALSLWFNDMAPAPLKVLPRPTITIADVLRPIPNPPLPPETVLFHEMNDHDPAGTIAIYKKTDLAKRAPRVGLVCTVYRGGSALDAWCSHHFSLGFDHIILIMSRIEEAAETADAQRLKSKYPADRLTIWAGNKMPDHWVLLADNEHTAQLQQFARLGRSSQAIAAQQSLNASAALQAAKTDAFGGQPLDWLLHIDSDELFYLEGAGRGGASLTEHFLTAEQAGIQLIRYLNHELLLPMPADNIPIFKINPRLAAARLGPIGWQRLEKYLQTTSPNDRPYFHGYRNGKSAVWVKNAHIATGIHSWYLNEHTQDVQRFLAGPSILHFRFGSSENFIHKYRHIAASPRDEAEQLFLPSTVEVRILNELANLAASGAFEADIAQGLQELHQEITCYSEEEIDLLQSAKLLLKPHLEYNLVV